MPKAKTPKAPKAPKAPKPVKLSKKSISVLDKAEIRHVAIMTMGLTMEGGAYRFKPNELSDWFLEHQDLFATADLSVCKESHLRPGVRQYLETIQQSMRGEGPAAQWPPEGAEAPPPEEPQQEEQMSHDDTFAELDDEDDVPETEEPATPTEPEPEPAPPPVEPTVPKPVRRPITPPTAIGKPSFIPVRRDAPAPAVPAPAELPGTITENISNMNNRINEMCDRLEQVTNSLDSKVQQIRGDITTHSTKARVDAVERTVKKLDQDMQILSTAVLHLINTIRPWADMGINTFPNLESLPDTSMYGDDINKEVENG